MMGSMPDDPGSARPRDPRGRAFNDRPRDALGRPLPHGSEGVPRQPEGVSRTPAETLDLAEKLISARRPFHAHDVFEDQWKQTSGSDRLLWRGLAQLAVGITHAARGNPRGASAVLARAAQSIAPFADDPPHAIDVAGLCDWAGSESRRLEEFGAHTQGKNPDTTAQDAPVWLDVPRLRTR